MSRHYSTSQISILTTFVLLSHEACKREESIYSYTCKLRLCLCLRFKQAKEVGQRCRKEEGQRTVDPIQRCWEAVPSQRACTSNSSVLRGATAGVGGIDSWLNLLKDEFKWIIWFGLWIGQFLQLGWSV